MKLRMLLRRNDDPYRSILEGKEETGWQSEDNVQPYGRR